VLFDGYGEYVGDLREWRTALGVMIVFRTQRGMSAFTRFFNAP
jgi:hypothetical protein